MTAKTNNKTTTGYEQLLEQIATGGWGRPKIGAVPLERQKHLKVTPRKSASRASKASLDRGETSTPDAAVSMSMHHAKPTGFVKLADFTANKFGDDPAKPATRYRVWMMGQDTGRGSGHGNLCVGVLIESQAGTGPGAIPLASRNTYTGRAARLLRDACIEADENLRTGAEGTGTMTRDDYLSQTVGAQIRLFV